MALKSNPTLAFIVIKAYANSNLFDKSDMYMCSSAVLGAACGLPVVDPLGAYKTKFVNKVRR